MNGNPSLNGNPNVLETPSTVGQNGRPPDDVVQLSCPSPLERSRDPGNPEHEPVDKKARSQEELLDASMMEVEDGQRDSLFAEAETDIAGTTLVDPASGGQERGHVENLKGRDSYASMVSRNSGPSGVQGGVRDAGSAEVTVLESDYVIDRSGPFPTVKFSDKDDCERLNKTVAPIGEPVVEGIHVNHEEPLGPLKDDLYGPWMVVDTRRRRGLGNSGPAKDVSGNKARPSTSHGSRFAELEVEDVMIPNDDSIEQVSEVRVLNTENVITKNTAGRGSKSTVQQPTFVKNAAYKASNPDKKSASFGKPYCCFIVGEVSRIVGSYRWEDAADARVRPSSQSALNEWAINFSKQLATSGDTVGGHVPAALLNGLTEVHGDGPTQSTILVKDVGTGSALEEPTALKTSSAKTL
ncbi:hypothetical protein V6N13_110996 [Hibiscus sabdariffa]